MWKGIKLVTYYSFCATNTFILLLNATNAECQNLSLTKSAKLFFLTPNGYLTTLLRRKPEILFIFDLCTFVYKNAIMCDSDYFLGNIISKFRLSSIEIIKKSDDSNTFIIYLFVSLNNVFDITLA